MYEKNIGVTENLKEDLRLNFNKVIEVSEQENFLFVFVYLVEEVSMVNVEKSNHYWEKIKIERL